MEFNANEQRVKEKLDFFMQERVSVHVKLKNLTFVNGIILRQIKENVYWLKENKLGEIFLFIKDIFDVDEFREVNGNGSV